jgi:hypothetical protein
VPQGRRWLTIRAALVIGAAMALVAVLAHRVVRRGSSTLPSPAPMLEAPSRPAASTDVLPPNPAGPAELALVSPLAPGSALAGFVIREIRGVERGRLRVVCARERAVVRLDVALVDPEGPLPPAVAGRYAVFYSLKGATPEEGERLAQKLAKAIGANAAVEPPPGMTTFKPDPTPATEL